MINLLQDFENYLRSVGLHKNSVRNYLTDLIKFSLWFEVKTGKKLSPSTLESSHINLYLKELQDSNIPASTIKRYFPSLTRFSSWMMPTHNFNYFTDQQTAKSSNKNMEGFEIYLKNSRRVRRKLLGVGRAVHGSGILYRNALQPFVIISVLYTKTTSR